MPSHRDQPTRVEARFRDMAAIHSSEPAVVDGSTVMTYADLDQASDDLRDELRNLGVTNGSLVSMCLPRGWQVPVAVLGILKSGAAYVPVDPSYPETRRRYLIEDSRTGFVVSASDAGRITITRRDVEGHKDLPLDLAYVIYTSGSTGAPKGVMVGHRQLLSLMDACDLLFDFRSSDVWTLFHSHSFDFSVWEIWGALLHGAKLVVVPNACARDPRRFAELLAVEGVTVLNQVPTTFSYLVGALEHSDLDLSRLRYVIFGGEALRVEGLRRFRSWGGAPHSKLVNMYGITETTVHATWCDVTAVDEDHGPTPIGRPLPHLEIATVGADGRAVQTGEEGEMVVSGAGVSYGYLNRPDLTAAKFHRGKDGTVVAYRSGDWGVKNESGEFSFICRKDDQVQIRGFRIEKGEIAAAMRQHPRVADCVVTAPLNRLGEPGLVAHLLTGQMPIGVEELRRYALKVLPQHLVPARFVHHDAWPLTNHGKIDIAALDSTMMEN